MYVNRHGGGAAIRRKTESPPSISRPIAVPLSISVFPAVPPATASVAASCETRELWRTGVPLLLLASRRRRQRLVVVRVVLLLRRLFLRMVLRVLVLEVVAVLVVLAPLSIVQHAGVSIAAVAPAIAVDWRTCVSTVAFCTVTNTTGGRSPHSSPAAAAAAASVPAFFTKGWPVLASVGWVHGGLRHRGNKGRGHWHIEFDLYVDPT